jgi:hypothetical protein
MWGGSSRSIVAILGLDMWIGIVLVIDCLNAAVVTRIVLFRGL